MSVNKIRENLSNEETRLLVELLLLQDQPHKAQVIFFQPLGPRNVISRGATRERSVPIVAVTAGQQMPSLSQLSQKGECLPSCDALENLGGLYYYIRRIPGCQDELRPFDAISRFSHYWDSAGGTGLSCCM